MTELELVYKDIDEMLQEKGYPPEYYDTLNDIRKDVSELAAKYEKVVAEIKFMESHGKR